MVGDDDVGGVLALVVEAVPRDPLAVPALAQLPRPWADRGELAAVLEVVFGLRLAADELAALAARWR